MAKQEKIGFKDNQWIRTIHPDEIESTKELERQAAKYPNDFILEGPRKTKRIALTFDDGPSEYTGDLLAVLKEQQVKVTFFLEGKKLEAYPKLAQTALADGHSLGNHTLNHCSSTELSATELWQDEIRQTNALFLQILGMEAKLFRPPYGEITDKQIGMLASNGMKLILWSIDPRDWDSLGNSVETLVSSVVDNLHDEAIILLHDGGDEPRNNSVSAVKKLIPICKSLGFEFVTVDQMLEY